jgi:hypothetical protein
MIKLFPVIPAGQPVPCFMCSQPLAGQPEPVENPPKRGQWRAYCNACDMFTFFDKGSPNDN